MLRNRNFIVLACLLLAGCGSIVPNGDGESGVSQVSVYEEDKAYILSDLSDRYPHGALGDDLEPTALYSHTTGSGKVKLVELPETQVFETNRIVLADVVGDPDNELLLTISEVGRGSAIAVYSDEGELLAMSDFLGVNFRWRHLIGVMTNEFGEKFIVDVVKPHLTGDLTLYRIEDSKIVPVFSEAGYNSHKYGSEDLDLAVIGRSEDGDTVALQDFDGELHSLKLTGDVLTTQTVD